MVSDKSEGGKLLYNAPLCVLMGSVYIHHSDSGNLFNAMPTSKKKKRIDHGHVCGINTFKKVLICLNFSRSSKRLNHCLFFNVSALLCSLFNFFCCF